MKTVVQPYCYWQYKQHTIGYNRITGEVVLFESSEEADQLNKECLTLVHGDISQDALVITIELNYYCNLSCIYCYQGDKGVRGTISKDTIDKIIEYIVRVHERTNYSYLEIRFIGGEPLLSMEELYYCYSAAEDFCRRVGIDIYVHIDTNGTIPIRSIVEKIQNVDIVICLSCKDDHNAKRDGSFQRIVANLRADRDLLGLVTVRYNVDHNSSHEFDTFLEFLSVNFPEIRHVIVERIYDPEYLTKYHNKMSVKDYSKWNSSIATCSLIQHGYDVELHLKQGVSKCQAYLPYSCKIFSDGAVSVCDAMMHGDALLNITNLTHDIGLLSETYSDIKKRAPWDNEKCLYCSDVVQCGGVLFCRKNKCMYQESFSIKDFVETFFDQWLKGNEDFFINMKS